MTIIIVELTVTTREQHSFDILIKQINGAYVKYNSKKSNKEYYIEIIEELLQKKNLVRKEKKYNEIILPEKRDRCKVCKLHVILVLKVIILVLNIPNCFKSYKK